MCCSSCSWHKRYTSRGFNRAESITNYAGAILTSGTAFYGVSGSVSVYNPKVDQEQTSDASMFIANQDSNNFDAISVGWHVLPSLYQDSATHLYIAWTSNNFEKGCMNTQCPGFVQTDKLITIGQSLNQISTIDKFSIDLSLAILQNSSTKDWWIYINEKKIGYYPASLFSNMASANQIVWIGKTTNPTNTATLPWDME
ncbi:protein neprosin-like [Vicia villosa]|uniref:protein neprosin-like n=1 Tax=Vicia villosa TaxID=3911 RepID=UPI00273C8921|nr:protein neprosin-like [Vicia villosa]